MVLRVGVEEYRESVRQYEKVKAEWAPEVEEYREQVSAQDKAAVTERIAAGETKEDILETYSPGRASHKASRERQKKSSRKAVEIYQATATPLDEETREISVEKPHTEGPGYVAPIGQDLVDEATVNLVERGYREEDIRTPFVELGGTPAGGFVPPYVQERINADAGIVPVPEPVMPNAPVEPVPMPVVPVEPVVADLPPVVDGIARKLILLGIASAVFKALAKE